MPFFRVEGGMSADHNIIQNAIREQTNKILSTIFI